MVYRYTNIKIFLEFVALLISGLLQFFFCHHLRRSGNHSYIKSKSNSIDYRLCIKIDCVFSSGMKKDKRYQVDPCTETEFRS